MFKNLLHYLNNKNLKAVGVKLQYTREQAEEYLKCYNYPIYFIETYVKIIDLDRGIVPFKMYDWQKEYINLVHDNRFTIGRVARQSGKSVAVISYLLWTMLFRDNQAIAILANKAQTARKLLYLLKDSYEHLPLWLQQGVLEWNKTSILLENGSSCIANSTSSSAARGGTFSTLVLDEFAFVPRNIADDFFTSVYPTISSGTNTKVVMISTPNGMNLFYKFWIDAIESRNLYKTYLANWSCVPKRDAKWKADTLANMGEIKFTQEFEVEFLGSQDTLISSTRLREMTFITPIREKNSLKLYELPKPDHIYVMTVDVSKGRDQDYSTFIVIDVTVFPYKVVAVYRNSTISPILYPEVISACAKEYNNAYVLIETNEVGSQVAISLMRELEYENILTTTTKLGKKILQIGASYSNNQDLGIQTTKSVKSIGCSNLKSIIESNQLIINDFNILSELTTFIARKQSFEADIGNHDDLVMNLVLFGWLYNQEAFKDLTDLNLKQKLLEAREDHDDSLPLGFINDGFNDETTESYVDSDGNLWEPVDSNDL